jgi:hypothetical protein
MMIIIVRYETEIIQSAFDLLTEYNIVNDIRHSKASALLHELHRHIYYLQFIDL